MKRVVGSLLREHNVEGVRKLAWFFHNACSMKVVNRKGDKTSISISSMGT